MWSSILEQAGTRLRTRRALYLLRFGEDAQAAVTRSLFTGKGDRELQRYTLGGVSFGTWEPVDEESSISIWELSNEASFDDLREIYASRSSDRVVYVIAVDTSSEVCTTAIEKFLLQMERHQKTCNLKQVTVAIVGMGSGGEGNTSKSNGSENMTKEKIEKISLRVDSSLIFADGGSSQLGPLRQLVVQNLFPELHAHTMNNSDRLKFCRLGRFTTEDGWDGDAAPEKSSAAQVENLESYVEDLAQQVLEEEPVVDMGATGAVNFLGCAHGGSRRCEKCEGIREEESKWMGGLQQFVSKVTRSSEDVAAAGASSSTRVSGREGESGGGNASLVEGQEGKTASADADKGDDATSFFQDLLSK